MRKLNHLFAQGLNIMVSLFSSATYMTIDFYFNPVLACKPHGPNDFSGGISGFVSFSRNSSLPLRAYDKRVRLKKMLNAFQEGKGFG